MKKYVNGKYIDMPDDEVLERHKADADMPIPEPTTEERIATLEATTDDMILLMADLIGGN